MIYMTALRLVSKNLETLSQRASSATFVHECLVCCALNLRIQLCSLALAPVVYTTHMCFFLLQDVDYAGIV